MASVKLRKSWLLCIRSAHSLSKIHRKLSVIKKKYVFKPIIFFPQVAFSGACVWNREHINRPNRGHTRVELTAVTRASPDNTVQPDQSNRSSPNRPPPAPTGQIFHPRVYFIYSINKINKSSRQSYFSCVGQCIFESQNYRVI